MTTASQLASPPRTRDVFISYSTKDKKWADAACAVLEKERIRCWIAPRDITPGAEWGAAIIDGIDASKVMVLIFSSNANESAQVRREVERAISKGLSVLPFRIEDVHPRGAMEYALGNTHWLDGFTRPIQRHFEALARSVHALLGEAPPSTDHPPALPVDSPDSTLPPARNIDRRVLLAIGSAAAVLLIGLGAFLFSKRSAPNSVNSDKNLIQGAWNNGFQRMRGEVTPKSQIAKDQLTWEIRGNRLLARRNLDGERPVVLRGTFELSEANGQKHFDFAGAGQQDRKVEFRGIYEVNENALTVCYRLRRVPIDLEPERPTSFMTENDKTTFFLRFRRARP